jgi:ribosomal protein L29
MDLKNKSKPTLLKMLTEKREDLRNFRFGITGSKVRNVKEGKALRKEIARILTKLNKKG